MKAKILITFLLLSISLYAQDRQQDSVLPPVPTNAPAKEGRIYLTKSNFTKIQNQTISGTLTGDKDLSSLSSFASVDIAKPTVTLTVSIPFYTKLPFTNKKTLEDKKLRKELSPAEDKSLETLNTIPNNTKEALRKIGSVVTVNFTGGITDGTATLFKDEKFNTILPHRFSIILSCGRLISTLKNMLMT